MNGLKNVGQGVYANGGTTSVGGMFPVWQDDPKTFRKMGVMTDMNAKFGTGSVTVVSIYPEGMRAGTLYTELANKNGMPIPIYRVVGAVSASATKVVIQQSYGLPVVVKGIKLVNCEDDTKVITASTIATNADGNIEVTIAAGAIGTLEDGAYLMLEDAKDYIPHGLTESSKEYDSVTDKSTLYIDNHIVDGGRIRDGLFAGLPESLRIKYLQTIKVD